MKRIFLPSKPEKTSVKKWSWKKSHGLKVHYKDGLSCKSSWYLPELLNATHEQGDGLPCIESKIDPDLPSFLGGAE